MGHLRQICNDGFAADIFAERKGEFRLALSEDV